MDEDLLLGSFLYFVGAQVSNRQERLHLPLQPGALNHPLPALSQHKTKSQSFYVWQRRKPCEFSYPKYLIVCIALWEEEMNSKPIM